MLRYSPTIPTFESVPKSLARPSTDLMRISKVLTSGSLTNNDLLGNTKETVSMVIASHRAVKTARDVRIPYGDSILEQKRSFKYLGVILDES